MKKAPSPHDRNFMKMCHKDPVTAAQLNLHIFVFCNIFHTIHLCSPVSHYCYYFQKEKVQTEEKTKKRIYISVKWQR